MESGTGNYMDTDPGVAFLICREGRAVTLQMIALVEALEGRLSD